MAAHSIPQAPPVLPFQQNILLCQHIWTTILDKMLLNGIGFRSGFHKSASLFAMTKMQAVVSSD
jgi:hypothetical protein